MRREGVVMSFWESEHREYCNGLIRQKSIELSRKVKGKYVVIVTIPLATPISNRFIIAKADGGSLVGDACTAAPASCAFDVHVVTPETSEANNCKATAIRILGP